MASSFQNLLLEVWRVIEADSSTPFVKAATPFFAEMIPATGQGLQFVARFDGGGVLNQSTTSHVVHDLVVEVLADTSPPDNDNAEVGAGTALSYVTALANILADGTTAPLGEHGARAVFTGYEVEPLEEGAWAIVRVNFEVTQLFALEP